MALIASNKTCQAASFFMLWLISSNSVQSLSNNGIEGRCMDKSVVKHKSGILEAL